MQQAVHHWLRALPFTNALEYRQARLLQGLLLGLLGVVALDLIAIQLNPESPISQVVLSILALLVEISLAGAFILLRRGRLRHAAALSTTVLFLVVAVVLFATGLRTSAILVVPVSLAGGVFGRRGIWLSGSLAIVLAVTVGILNEAQAPLVGSLPAGNRTFEILLVIGLVLVLLTLFLDRFSAGFHEALATMEMRAKEMGALRQSLEATVAERTAALAIALQESEQREDRLKDALAKVEQQRTEIREMSLPVIPISTSTLVMPLIGALDSVRLSDLQTQALQAIERRNIRSLVLDITGVMVVDSQVAQGILSVVQAARLLGTEVLLVGIRPEVAQAIVELGLNMPGLRTYSDLQAALSQEAVQTARN